MDGTFQAHVNLNQILSSSELSQDLYVNRTAIAPSDLDQGVIAQDVMACVPQYQLGMLAENPWTHDPIAVFGTDPPQITTATSAKSQFSNDTDLGQSFLLQRSAENHEAIKREMMRTLSVVPIDNPETGGTNCIGPVHIRKVPGVAVSEAQSTRYKFQFVLPDRSSPTEFHYTTSKDLHEAVEDFIINKNIDPELSMPICWAVQTCLDDMSVTHWRLVFGASCGDAPASAVATTASYERPSSNEKTEGQVSAGWIVDHPSQDGETFRRTQYTPSTGLLQVTYSRNLLPVDRTRSPNALGTSCQMLDPADLLKMYFGTSAADNMDAFYSRTAFNLVCSTLMTVAQSLHTRSAKCACDFNMMEDGMFTLDFMQHITSNLPPSPGSELPLSQRRAGYAFDQLENSLRSLEQILEPLLDDLRLDKRSSSAAECILSSLDAISGSHAAFIGHWAWDNLITPLNPRPAPSLTSTFIGRPGNSGIPIETRESIHRVNDAAQHYSSENAYNTRAGEGGESSRLVPLFITDQTDDGAVNPADPDIVVIDDCESVGETSQTSAAFRHSARNREQKTPHYNTKRHPQDDMIPSLDKKRKKNGATMSSPRKKRQVSSDEILEGQFRAGEPDATGLVWNA